MNGQISTAVGWTIPLLTKALNEDPGVVLVVWYEGVYYQRKGNILRNVRV